MSEADAQHGQQGQGVLAGLSALVAGGGSGIGAATARVLAARGARVLVTDVDETRAAAVARGLRDHHDRISSARLDVADPADIDRAVAHCSRLTVGGSGALDILVNAAGLVRPAPLAEASMEDWREVFRVNVEGALLLARACLPLLEASGHGAIVNVASLGGIYSRPNAAAYGPSKAALISLSRQMGLEWGPQGVRVNVVNPGTIDTPLSRRSLTDETVGDRESVVPLGRIGAAEEVAEVIAFLASPLASYVTAQSINVDGGHSQSLLSAPMVRRS